MKFLFYALMPIPAIAGATALVAFIESAVSGKIFIEYPFLAVISFAFCWALWRLAKGHRPAGLKAVLKNQRSDDQPHS